MKNQKNQTTVVIAGFAGIGKTKLAEKYQNVIDLESSLFVYDYSGLENLDKEKLKGTENRKPNKAFPLNYINAIKESIDNYDYIFVWLHGTKSFPHYKEHGIDFEIFMPERELMQDEYRQRFIVRGNSQKWIENCLDAWDRHFQSSLETGKKITFLKSGETLESFLTNNPNYPKLVKRS